MDSKVRATENIPPSSYREILQKAGEEVQKVADKQDEVAFDKAWAKYEELLRQFGFKK